MPQADRSLSKSALVKNFEALGVYPYMWIYFCIEKVRIFVYFRAPQRNSFTWWIKKGPCFFNYIINWRFFTRNKKNENGNIFNDSYYK